MRKLVDKIHIDRYIFHNPPYTYLIIQGLGKVLFRVMALFKA